MLIFVLDEITAQTSLHYIMAIEILNFYTKNLYYKYTEERYLRRETSLCTD